MKLASEDLTFLRSLGRAVLALAASALVLLAFSVVYFDRYNTEGANSAGSLTIPGSQFQTIMGITEVQDDALVLKYLQLDGGEQVALISHHIKLSAEQYPLLRYKLAGIQPDMKVQFFWRTAETPDTIFSAHIPEGGGEATFANLAASSAWRDTVTSIGLYITGDLRNRNLIIPGLTLEPYTRQGMISAVFFEWTGFRGWKGSSINLLQGTPGARGSETLSPTLAVAIWAGLALVFLYGISVVQDRKSLVSYCAVVLIPWLALDQLWQSELSTQMQETRRVFSGKTTHQKHLADSDSYIYSYSKRLKDKVLPASPARIIILASPGDTNRYMRLKTQYYLLPHNMYNYGLQPPQQGIHPGDYILVLGDIPGLRYLSAEELLAWEPNRQVRASLVDTDNMGRLFHVTPVESGVTEVPARARGD